jgi:hypothetical protein
VNHQNATTPGERLDNRLENRLSRVALYGLRPLSQILGEHQYGLSIPDDLLQFVAIERVTVDFDQRSRWNSIGDVAAILLE